MNPTEYLNNSTIYSNDLIWESVGNQEEEFKDKPEILHDKIIIAKLREGQEIELELYCSKGVGRTHAKWSPVSTAYYRLKPSIEFEEPIEGEEVFLN